MVAFNSIPNSLRIPFVTAEFDNSLAGAGGGTLAYKVLLMGQKVDGSATANTIHRVSNEDEVGALVGRTSLAFAASKTYFANNRFTETFLGVTAAGTTAATYTITFTAGPTVSGSIPLYIDGTMFDVPVTAAMTVTQVAAAVDSFFTAKEPDLPYVVSASVGVVTITLNDLGLVGNDFPVQIAAQFGDKVPAGLVYTIAAGVVGSGAPTLDSLISAMGDDWFQIIAHPFTGATQLTSIENELASRFGPMRMIDGLAITGAAGSVGTLTTLGLTRNSPHNCIVAPPGVGPSFSPHRLAYGTAAVAAYYGAIDPARPFQTLPVTRLLPAKSGNFTDTERNTLLYSGVATTKRDAGGGVSMDRLITTYRKNGAGADDESYLDSNTMLTLMFLRYTWRNRILLKYPRHKLASDGSKFGSGQPIVTPSIMRGEAVAWFSEMEHLGLVEGIKLFKSELVVERNAGNANRIDVSLPPDLINQLMVTATKIQFRI